MARKIRTETEGGLFHVINRGNYRAWIFAEDGAKVAFEKALFEACEHAGWVLHAFCIMGNHFHLALETPRGNLSEGMRWLQSVFAHRFNRFRKESGRLFQGRFKSVAVEDSGRLGSVCHYIHLNPVRAGICPVDTLTAFRWSSLWYLNDVRKRPACLDLGCALEGAGGLPDTRRGRERYVEYLAWLNGDESSQERMEFGRMSRGMALGSAAFQKALVTDERRLRKVVQRDRRDAIEARKLAWEARLEQCFRVLKMAEKDIARAPKSAAWKVAIAGHLKRRLMCSNGWIAERLGMGVLFAVSRYVGEMSDGRRPEALALFAKLSARIKE